MSRYLVSIEATPPTLPSDAAPARTLRARGVVVAPCANAAARDLASYYLSAGLVVEWRVRRTGLRRMGQQWSGRLIPGDDDGLSGVREPRRPAPSTGTLSVALDPDVAA
jgi:hypothetical protein